MTHGDLTFLLYVAWAALALWCIPWATILHAIDRAAQRRIDRMVADGLTAIDWTPGPDPFLVGPDLRRDPDRDATHCGTCGRAVVKRNGQPVRHKDQPGGVWCGRAS